MRYGRESAYSHDARRGALVTSGVIWECLDGHELSRGWVCGHGNGNGNSNRNGNSTR